MDGRSVAELLVVVPTYNEAESLETVIRRTYAAVPDAHVLVVDDSSPDGTGEIADRLATEFPGLSVLHRPGKQGLGRAYLDGFAHAFDREYAFIAEMDADGSHDPADLPAMLELARTSADLVIGSRWVPGGGTRNWPAHRRAISRAGNLYSRVVLGSRIKDITAGFRVYRAARLRELGNPPGQSQGYCLQVELAWRLEKSGARVIEHPIIFVERETGRSKMTAGIVTEALVRVTGWGLTRGLRRRAV